MAEYQERGNLDPQWIYEAALSVQTYSFSDLIYMRKK